MTQAEVEAHQRRHGFGGVTIESHDAKPQVTATSRLPTPVKMTRPEREYGLILASMKGRGEIVDYRFQGVSLAWGKDPETGVLMRYKCDYLVIHQVLPLTYSKQKYTITVGDEEHPWSRLAIIEVKGKHIFKKDIIRFKGCRAEWPMFQFEMHQLANGVWRRVL